MEVIHLDYRPGTAGWVLRLQSRLQASPSDVLRTRYSRWGEAGLADLAIAVATRLSLTLRVSFRLAELLKKLRDEIDASGDIDQLLTGGFVYSPKDARIFYDICVAVDAFYFEFRSSYEVLGRFVRTFGREILGRSITEHEILQVLEAANCNRDWIDPVRENRKLFFHETAPWIALEVHQRRPLECSVLVMKENLHEFDHPDKYVTQSHLVNTVTGFQQAVWAVFGWLGKEIDKSEAQTQSSAS